MPKVHPIDEPPVTQDDSPRLDKTANNTDAALPGRNQPVIDRSNTMNAKSLIAAATAAVALMGAASAFAQEATPDTWINEAASTKSRADVNAELRQARRDGTSKFGSAGYMERSDAGRTRLQVQAEVIAARRSGELAEINAEAHAFGTPSAPSALAGRK
jgi:hypothetical protein